MKFASTWALVVVMSTFSCAGQVAEADATVKLERLQIEKSASDENLERINSQMDALELHNLELQALLESAGNDIDTARYEKLKAESDAIRVGIMRRLAAAETRNEDLQVELDLQGGELAQLRLTNNSEKGAWTMLAGALAPGGQGLAEGVIGLGSAFALYRARRKAVRPI